MPITTPLNTPPYNDDFTPTKDYYQVLFKPSVAVQVRELNVLQSMLQNQIEQFGDNILESGTIVSGCSFNYNTNLPYVKIVDSQGDGNPVNVGDYNNYFLKGSITGLTAYVVNTVPGYVSSDPDLNTLYVNYTNGNVSANTFVPNETLTVYDSNNSIWEVTIVNGSSGFANTDSLIFIPALTVANSAGGSAFVNIFGNSVVFTVGQRITGATSNASAIITEVNNTINSTSLVLKVKPITANLSFVPANTSAWTFSNGESIFVLDGVQGASITSVIGENASGTLTTDAFGSIVNTNISDRGVGYYVPPYVTVISPTGSYTNLNLIGQNYIATVNVASVLNPTGFGYAFGVSNGVIYQKGYFSRVESQSIVVSKYNNTPNLISVGFNTVESIANSNIDNSLFDNSLGTTNETAPGADRLQLTPTLVYQTTSNAQSNNEFLSIVEFNEGLPFVQRNDTQFSTIETEIANREFQTSGNFVTTPFTLTTESPSIQNNESFAFNAVISPGSGFLNGYQVNTQAEYITGVFKGTDTAISANVAFSLNYGNYIRINNMGGLFQFNTGDAVSLWSQAANFLGTSTNFSAAITEPGGPQIGTARIRSLVYEGNSDAGSPTAIYRLYLFDIVILQGFNFGNVRSVYYNVGAGGIGNAIADIVTSTSATTGEAYCQLQNPTSAKNQLVVASGAAMKNTNNINYSYRTLRSSNCNTSGIVTVTLTNPGESWPYSPSTTLLPTQEEDILIIPAANIVASTTSSGTLSVNTTSNSIIGSATTLTTLAPGDYIQINSGGSFEIKRITGITNATFATMDSNSSFANTTSTFSVALPQNIPVAMATKNYRSINIDSTGETLTINLGNTFTSNVSVKLAYNVNVANAQPLAKTPFRSSFVRLQSNTNLGNTVGPWLLGIPDIFRLRGVWVGSNNTFDNTTGLNVTTNFFIDHNQNQDYYDLGYLYIKPTANYVVPNNGVLLVELDAYEALSSNGFGFDVNSYPINDTLTLPQLENTNSVNTLEIPEFYSSTGNYYDLRDVFDFRPRVVNSAIYTTNAIAATVNPTYPANSVAFGNTTSLSNDKKFPVPQSGMSATIERYMGRTDLAVINGNSNFQIIKGSPFSTSPPVQPQNTITVNFMKIPPYPSLPQVYSTDLSLISDTGIASKKFTYKRLAKYAITEPTTSSGAALSQPIGYTMSAIGSLESRITNLEYYMGLTLQQQAIASTVIPSSNDPSQDRYKFGFFVDDFSTSAYSDTTDPEYNATIINHQLTVKADQLNLEFDYANNQNGKIAILPYVPYKVLSQSFATNDSNSNPTSCPTYHGHLSVNPEYFSVIAQVVRSGTSSGGITSESGPWTSTISFNIQNGVLNEYQTAAGVSPASDGKTIKATTQTNQVVNFNNSSVNVDGSTPSLAQIGQALSLGWKGSITPQTGSEYVSGDRKFEFYISGLRPNTLHNFYYAGNNMSSFCYLKNAANTGGYGVPLVSSIYGDLAFDFYYTSPITAELANSSIQWSDALVYRSYISKLSGIQTVAVSSVDGISSATGTVDAIGVYGPNGTVPWFVDEISSNGQIYTPDFSEETSY